MAGNGNQGGSGGGGPKIPRNLRPDLEQINSLLQDIGTKISSLHQLDDTFKLNVEVKNLDKFSKLESSMKSASKINATLAKNLGARAKTEMELNKTIDDTIKKLSKQGDVERELSKRIDDLEKKKAKSRKLNKEDAKTLEEAIHQKKDLKDAIKDNQKVMEDETEKLEKLDSKWAVLGKTLGNQVLGALDKVGTGLTSLAIDAVFFSLEKLRDGFLKVYDLMERTTKAVGDFNIGIGGTTKGLDETRKEAFKVEGQLRSLTGGELGVGLKMWEETSQAIGFVGGDFDKMATKATLAGRALGIGGTAAGELTRTMSLLGSTSKDVNKEMVEVSDAANDAGVSVASFGKELTASKGFMASFGKAGRKVFLDSAAYAKKLGVSLQSLQRFTDMTDTFESTATAAGKMNSVFGTSINSMELMLEQDPSKRLEMVKNQFQQQGKTWESMSRQERKFFAQTMDLSEEEAAGVLNSNMTLEQFQKKQAKDKKNQISDEKKIRDGLAKTAETLFNFGQAWDGVTASIAELIKPFLKVFGLVKDGSKEGKTFGGVMKEAFGTLTGFIKSIAEDPKFQEMIAGWAADFKDFAIRVKDFVTSGKLKAWIDDVRVGVSGMYDSLKRVATVLDKEVFTDENVKMAKDIFGTVMKYLPSIVSGFLALKGIMGMGSIISGLNGMTKLITGGDGLFAVMKGFGSALTDIASKAFPTFTSMLSNAGGMLASSFGKVVGALTSNVGDLTKTLGGKAGAIGALAAAGLAGWEFGTKLREWFPQIDTFMQKMLDGISGFFGDLWKRITHTGFYKTLFGSDAADSYDKADAAEAAYQKAMKADEQKKMVGAQTAPVIHLTPPKSVSATTPATPVMPVTATPLSPITSSQPQSAAPVQKQEPKNLAAERTKEKEKASKAGLTLVAGDVFLDSNLVGRHLLRGAGQG